MQQSKTDPHQQREFALGVVRRLRDAGYESLFAGGCVRDALLNRQPDDYDVATSATPEQVVQVFRRTIPVGANFGVVVVPGRKAAEGQVEVATFRADGDYLDGRRPTEVVFCSAQEDAQRRDFTINGMFFDPVEELVIDYVGGQDDLRAGILRSIGNPVDRFTEDKLRMLRAVRFASTYEFHLDPDTREAICNLHADLVQVSVERIAQELRRMLAHPNRHVAFRFLQDTGLLNVICQGQLTAACDSAVAALPYFRIPSFESAFAVLAGHLLNRDASVRKRGMPLRSVCRDLRLSNTETNDICWLAESLLQIEAPERLNLHQLKPILADSRHDLLIDLSQALDVGAGTPPKAARWIEGYLEVTPPELLDPAPLVFGGDIEALGVSKGPVFAELLNGVRQAQLDEEVNSRDEGLALLRQLARDTES